MVRSLPFRETSARPARAASTVIYFTSLTRMPVAQMVSSSKASRSRPRPTVGGVQQALIFLPGQLPPVVPEQLPLDFQGLHLAVLPAQEGEKTGSPPPPWS